MTLTRTSTFLSLLLHSALALKVVRHSPPVEVLQGEEAHLFCEADERFDSCVWELPSGARCGPLSSTQSMCRTAPNIHWTGGPTNCSIRIDGLKEDQSGLWNCSLRIDNDVAVATNMEVTVGQKASVDWDGDVYGEYLISNRDSREQKLTCRANHSRPAGRFLWFLGEGSNMTRVENSREQVSSRELENNMVEEWQTFSLEPRPELQGKTLSCHYVQEYSSGGVMFESEVSVELLVHYLAPLPDPDLLLGPGGEDYNISFQFEAQPRPDEVTWFIQGDSETVIPVSPKEQRVIQNYVVYPLHQVSQFVWRATLTILEVTAEENYKDHYIVVSSRLNQDSEPLQIREDFDVVVAGLTITVIVVIIIVLVILIILVAMLVVYLKKKNLLCFEDRQSHSLDVDVVLKEPLNHSPDVVKHHPYSRPSS